MAARRNKSQARRTGGNNGTPGWVWLVVGVVLGAALLFTLPGLLKKDGDGFFRPTPNPDARPAPVAESDDDAPVEAAPRASAPATAARPAAEEAAKETQYDFYTLLPGKEVRMSDAELAASARAEQERQRQWEAQQARTAQAGNPPADTTAPRPIDETPAPAVVTAPKPVDAPKPVVVASAPAAPTQSSARYILQAGAFGASGDAESTKARIAMLGLSARVESAQIGGKTVYRVRMGPYGSASELADAKQKLANGGLPAMAIRAQ
ncbi:MAG: SPOR domain-containing protein [Pseudoxanthomonas sp.]